jgi:hypothetical protein
MFVYPSPMEFLFFKYILCTRQLVFLRERDACLAFILFLIGFFDFFFGFFFLYCADTCYSVARPLCSFSWRWIKHQPPIAPLLYAIYSLDNWLCDQYMCCCFFFRWVGCFEAQPVFHVISRRRFGFSFFFFFFFFFLFFFVWCDLFFFFFFRVTQRMYCINISQFLLIHTLRID